MSVHLGCYKIREPLTTADVLGLWYGLEYGFRYGLELGVRVSVRNYDMG